ncbi:MAG: hypothetical protein ACO3FE_04650 [Planctomycetaceae bacterium]
MSDHYCVRNTVTGVLLNRRPYPLRQVGFLGGTHATFSDSGSFSANEEIGSCR